MPKNIAEKQKAAQQLADNFAYEAIVHEPIPPWLKYPQARESLEDLMLDF